MKINFLAQLQMAYSDYYGCADEVLEAHVDALCGSTYVPEYGRIRKGAWIADSYHPTLIADPTNAALWTAGITAGSIILSKEFNGTFDGGSPVTSTGWGDAQDFTTGYNFTATLQDRVYKENFAHYQSLAGTTTYHLAYVTQTQVHISGAVVSVAVKAAITANTTDLVVWEATVKWFEQFVPAPHDMPAGIF